MPHLLLGVLLVTSCTAGAVVWSTTTGERRAALVLARPVAPGHVLEPRDLREIMIAAEGGVDVIPAENAASVVGMPVTATLPAGALLPRGALGPAPVPEDGRAVAAVALHPGQAPSDLAIGASVLVVAAADPTTGLTEPSGLDGERPDDGWPGVVLAVEPAAGAGDGQLVVSVELAEDDARAVASAPVGQLSLVVKGRER